MQLTGVKIHNFRGIVDQDLALNSYSLLVGPNNAGKSSVIDAIRAFYEKDGFKFKAGNDFPYVATTDQESWVELAFSLTDEENE
jgi:putative ATP-dependent endonuclease of the OLD family